MTTLTIQLLGPSGSGKTTFVERHRSGEFLTCPSPTSRTKITSLPFYTSVGDVTFRLIEHGVVDETTRPHGYLVFFDLTCADSFEEMKMLLPELAGPVVIVGNKVDLKGEREVPPKIISAWLDRARYSYYDISALSNYNFEKPFLSLLRTLSGVPAASFTEAAL